jgi:hypothetical protein
MHPLARLPGGIAVTSLSAALRKLSAAAQFREIKRSTKEGAGNE